MSITTLGKQHIADRLAATPTETPMANIAIGTGTPSSTALGTELSRKAWYSRTSSSNVTTYVVRWDIEDNISGTITEVGIFNAANLGGTMFLSLTMSQVKAINDSLTITIAVTI